MAGLTIDNPTTLRTALQSENLLVGDTLRILPGTYAGDYTWNCSGIIVNADPGVKFTGFHDILGSNNILSDIEWAGDRTGALVELGGAGNKLIRCIIHDGTGGISGGAGTGCEVIDSLIYFCGVPDSDNSHNIYAQNVTGTKKFTNIISFDSFGYTFHGFASSPNRLNGLQLLDSIFFQSGDLRDDTNNYLLNIHIGGNGGDANDCLVDNCVSYYNLGAGSKIGGGVRFGYSSGCKTLTLTDNIFMAARAGVGLNQGVSVSLLVDKPAVMTGNDIYSRIEFNSNSFDHATEFPDNDYLAFGIPDQVKLTACTSIAGRAHLAIMNGSAANTVAVDTTGIFANDDVIDVHNAQDYFVDIQELTVAGNSITVNMQAVNRSVATPVDWVAPAKTFPTFGAFVLEKQ